MYSINIDIQAATLSLLTPTLDQRPYALVREQVQ